MDTYTHAHILQYFRSILSRHRKDRLLRSIFFTDQLTGFQTILDLNRYSCEICVTPFHCSAWPQDTIDEHANILSHSTWCVFRLF